MSQRISLQQRKAFVGYANGKMGEVIDDEGEHDQSAHHHVPGCEGGLHVVLVDVRVGASPAVIDGETNGHEDVKYDRCQEKRPDRPKQWPEIAKMLGVTVDPIRSEKDLQVAEQMANDEQDQNDARHSDDHFFADRRLIKVR